jgi:hypothetical protein
MLNLEWVSTEQEFTHKQAVETFSKMNRDQMCKIFSDVFQQYQVKSNLFAKLSLWCACNNVVLPSFEELLSMGKTVKHPTELEK